MSVLTVADLIAHLGGEADDGRYQVYIDQAEAAVASYIGADSIEREAAEQTQYIFLEQNSRQLRLDAGPLESIVSVIDANDATIDYTSIMQVVSPWLLEMLDPANVSQIFGAFGVMEVKFNQGWTDELLPIAMRLAILNTAHWILERPAGGIASESIGDYSYTIRQAVGAIDQTLPASAQDQLSRFRNAELAL